MVLLSNPAIFKKSTILNFVLVIALVSLLFSELAYTLTSYGPVSVFLWVALPLSIVWALFSNKFSMRPLMAASYSFYLVLALYTLVGVVTYSRVSLGIQFISSLVSAYLFLNIGFYGDRKLVARCLVAVLWIVFVFAISQFIYFTFGMVGPYSMFKDISTIVTDAQTDFSVENIYGRSSGIFTSPNLLGFFGGIVFWILVFLRGQVTKPVLVISLMLSVFCVFLSISRGSIFGLISSSIFLFFYGGWWKSVSGRGLLFSLFAFLVFSCLFSYYFFSLTDDQAQRFAEIFSVAGGDYSSSDNFSSRIEAWSSIVGYIKNKPFGTILPPQLLIGESPDNQFIYYFAQGGPILLISSLFFYMALFFWSILASGKNGYIFSASIIFVIVNCVSITAMNSYIYMLFCMMIGLFSRDRLRV